MYDNALLEKCAKCCSRLNNTALLWIGEKGNGDVSPRRESLTRMMG